MNIRILASLLLISANLAMAGGSSTAGTGNPATDNCIQLGGQDEDSQYQNGTANCIIEQWQLFRELKKRNLIPRQPVNTSVTGLANPAATTCIHIGGSLRYVNQTLQQTGYCVIEQWTLFRLIRSRHN